MVDLKTGKKPAVSRPTDFKMATLLADAGVVLPAASALPARFGHGDLYKGGAWQMFGNDRYGDCVFAGAAHEHMMINHVVRRKEIRFSDASVLGDYGAVTGFTPKDPNSDQGTVVADALAYRRKTGIVDASGIRHKIGAYVALDPKNWDHLRLAVYFFGAVGIGFNCPDNVFDQFDAGLWDVDGKQHEIEGGHYVPVVGEPNSHKVAVVSWARRQEMTRAYYEEYNDEAWVYFTEEELDSHGLGLHAQLTSTLNAYLSQLRG